MEVTLTENGSAPAPQAPQPASTFLNRLAVAVLLASAPILGHAADPVLSPNAPKDQPRQHASPDELDRAIAPYVAQARATYPAAKRRYLAGLPQGEHFFLTTRLQDRRGRVEQVFIAVSAIEGSQVTGRIWNDVIGVEGHRRGDSYTFDESRMLDWLITKPDGREEGNVVGRFLDTYRR